VSLSGAIGGTVEANLVKLRVSHVDISVGIEIVYAVCATATHPLILNSEFIQKLQKQRSLYVSSVTENIDDSHDNDDDDVNGHNNDDACNNDLSVNDLTVEGDKGQGHINDVVSPVEGGMSDNQAFKPGIQLLIDEQVNAESLKGSFSLPKRNKGNLFLKNGILHRLDKLAGQYVEQLVLPDCRREQA